MLMLKIFIFLERAHNCPPFILQHFCKLCFIVSKKNIRIYKNAYVARLSGITQAESPEWIPASSTYSNNGRDVNMCFYIEGGGKSPPSLQPASRSSATPSSGNTQQGPMIGKLLVQFAILPCPSHSKRFTEYISFEQATKSCTAESILCCLSKKQYYQEAENYF